MKGKQLDVQHTNTGYLVTESFTELFEGDVQDDLALAEALQDQESAYWSLQTSFGNQGNIGSTSTSSVGGHNRSIDANCCETSMTGITRNQDHQLQLKNDEALARALQEAEDHNNEIHLMPTAKAESIEEHHVEMNNSQETSESIVDPDNMSYEELLALGDAVGTHNRGLPQELISSLPSSKYKTKIFPWANKNDLCVICHMDYKKGDQLITLPCKHPYHAECITQWLQINKDWRGDRGRRERETHIFFRVGSKILNFITLLMVLYINCCRFSKELILLQEKYAISTRATQASALTGVDYAINKETLLKPNKPTYSLDYPLNFEETEFYAF